MSRALLLPVLLSVVSGQSSPTLSVQTGPTVKVKKGSAATVSFRASLTPGFHCNSSTPNDPSLIPLRLTWTGGPLGTGGTVEYPKGKLEKYSFSETPISVLSGDFTITTKFNVPASAPSGPAMQTGKLRYQACNDHACFPPKTVEVNASVNVE